MTPEFSAISGVDKEGSGSKKKRPMGLKARAAATKKQKGIHHSNDDNNQSAANTGNTSSNTEPAAAGVNDFDEANMATIMLKGEATEIDELEGIFESAMGEVSAAAVEENTERAVTLLRGTIHECDRILRVHHRQHQSQTHKGGEDVADGSQPPPLEPRFYYIYGSALYSITELSDEQDGNEKDTEKAEYLELALERLGQARDGMAGTEAFAWRVHMGMAKTALELMTLGGERGGDADAEQQHNHSLTEAIESLDSALATMRHDPAMDEETAVAAAGESLGAVDLVLSLADSRRLAPELNVRLVAWGESKLHGMLEDPRLSATDTSSDIRYLLARALWLQASALLDAQDEDEDEDEDDEEKEEEGDKKIVDLLRSASKLLEDASTSEALLLRGEVLLNLGNVQDTADAQEQLYEQAIDTFKRAQQIGQIPDSFVQLISDFDNGINADEDDEDS